jgi:hypothetical protein
MNIKKIITYETLWLHARKEFHKEWISSTHPSLIRKYEERYCNGVTLQVFISKHIPSQTVMKLVVESIRTDWTIVTVSQQ